MRRDGRSRQAGFTLIEIMVVVFILGLLVARVAPNVMSAFRGSQRGMAKAQIAGYAQAVKMFSFENGRYPTEAEGLAALIPPPPADLPNYDPDGYVEDQRLHDDPWGSPYIYRLDGRRFAIISYGADGRPGGDYDAADIDSRTM